MHTSSRMRRLMVVVAVLFEWLYFLIFFYSSVTGGKLDGYEGNSYSTRCKW